MQVSRRFKSSSTDDMDPKLPMKDSTCRQMFYPDRVSTAHFPSSCWKRTRVRAENCNYRWMVLKAINWQLIFDVVWLLSKWVRAMQPHKDTRHVCTKRCTSSAPNHFLPLAFALFFDLPLPLPPSILARFGSGSSASSTISTMRTNLSPI